MLVFGDVIDKDGSPFGADMRGILKSVSPTDQFKKDGYTLNAANEIEGFVFAGLDAERHYHETHKFEYVNTGGYYHSLPGDPLRTFIDTVAEVQRAMGFENEKDHPEVAPSQFEINYSYGEVVAAADTIQLYKLICRQVATKLGMTACFLPKPVVGVNGSGMHTNVSVTQRRQEPLLGSEGRGEAQRRSAGSSSTASSSHGDDICLLLNSSVNAYRRLDPHFEAPNQIKASAVDRGSMVRIPIGNERSSRVEVRSVAPDANPYMVMLARVQDRPRRQRSPRSRTCARPSATCPTTSTTRWRDFRRLELDAKLLGDDVEGPLRRPQGGQRRPLPAPARNVRQARGSAVPP